MRFSSVLVAVALLLISSGLPASSTRVKGSISFSEEEEQDFVFFLNRFGVGKGHDIHVYGTVARRGDDQIGFHSLMTLGFIPQGAWDGFYSKAPRRTYNLCDKVIRTTLNASMIWTDNSCSLNGTQDYLRKLPCRHQDGDYTICNQPLNVPVLEGQDFTFRIKSPKTEFYYLFLMSCTRNGSMNCEWASTDQINIEYDISLVNELPNNSIFYNNEFPYDLQGTLTLQIVFMVFYSILIGMHFLLHSRLCVRDHRRYSMHFLVKLFSASLVLESVYVILELIHSLVYAGNGHGVVTLKYLGEVANQFSDWLLILVVILVGKGWQVTTSSLRWSKVTAAIWGTYILFSAIYFVWMIVAEQVYPFSLTLHHAYQSWAGGLYLAYRLFILVYLLYEMRQVYLIEIRTTALWLYIILAVCYVVWFCYLPLITLIALLVNPVRRILTMSAVYLIFDFLINFGMVMLFCPRWANKFFQFNSYINLLSQTPFPYKNLKTYGGPTTPSPV